MITVQVYEPCNLYKFILVMLRIILYSINTSGFRYQDNMNKYVLLLSESAVSLFLNICFQGLGKVTKVYFKWTKRFKWWTPISMQKRQVLVITGFSVDQTTVSRIRYNYCQANKEGWMSGDHNIVTQYIL